MRNRGRRFKLGLLKQFIKCKAIGKKVLFVDPISQKCSKCSYIDKNNRKGLLIA